MTAAPRVRARIGYGRHRYSLEAFGLTESEVLSAFGPYIERHGLQTAVARRIAG